MDIYLKYYLISLPIALLILLILNKLLSNKMEIKNGRLVISHDNYFKIMLVSLVWPLLLILVIIGTIVEIVFNMVKK